MAENVDYGLAISESNQEFMILPDKVKVRSRSKGSTSVFLVNVGMFECLNVRMLECLDWKQHPPLPLCLSVLKIFYRRVAETLRRRAFLTLSGIFFPPLCASEPLCLCVKRKIKKISQSPKLQVSQQRK